MMSGVSVRSTNGPSSCISPVNSHIITTSDCGITCPAISITGDSAKALLGGKIDFFRTLHRGQQPLLTKYMLHHL